MFYLFSKVFTITAWVKIVEYRSFTRLIDCGNGDMADNVIFSLSDNGNNGRPFLLVFHGLRQVISTVSAVQIPLNEWTHLAAVYDGEYGIIFINGREVSSSEFAFRGPKNVTRSKCYIGKSSSNSNNTNLPNAYFDEISIYNVALSQLEIAKLISESELYKLIEIFELFLFFYKKMIYYK